MQTCDHCGDTVTDKFVRVFGNERGEVLACPNCTANVGIIEVSRQRAQNR